MYTGVVNQAAQVCEEPRERVGLQSPLSGPELQKPLKQEVFLRAWVSWPGLGVEWSVSLKPMAMLVILSSLGFWGNQGFL